MTLQDVLGKMRRADKIVVRDEAGELFNGFVVQCGLMTKLADREIDSFYPELFGGLTVNLKKG